MTVFLIRAVVLAAMILPVAACYSRVDTVPVATQPTAILVAPTQPTIVPAGSVVVKPY